MDWLIEILPSNWAHFIIVIGESGNIAPGRGLRQGDLLSFYLFIFCTAGLSTLLKKCEMEGDIHGVKVCRGAPVVTHLLFADNCFFCFAGQIRKKLQF